MGGDIYPHFIIVLDIIVLTHITSTRDEILKTIERITNIKEGLVVGDVVNTYVLGTPINNTIWFYYNPDIITKSMINEIILRYG